MLRPVFCIAVAVLGATITMVYNYQPVAGGEAPAAAVVGGTADPAAEAADTAPIAAASTVPTPAPPLATTSPQTAALPATEGAAPVTLGAAAPVAAAIEVIVPPVKRVMPKLVVQRPVAKPTAKDAKSAPAPATTKAAAIKSKPKKLTENEKGSKKVSRD